MLSRISSFFFMLMLTFTGIFNCTPSCYDTYELFSDSDFSDGFSVVSMQTNGAEQIKLGEFTYSDSEASPSWSLAQWNSRYCLWNERIDSDRYTLTDGKTKWVTYNPDNSSVSMRLNACGVYDGKPSDGTSWPHLLIEQSPFKIDEDKKSFYSCDADRLVVNLDIRLSDFKDTTNPDGVNAAQYLAYFYIKSKSGNDFIWFGLNLFDSRGKMDTYWALDTAGSGNMIYTVSDKDVYGTFNRSLLKSDKPNVSDEWRHISIDLTPHIDKLFKEMKKSDRFADTVSKSDFYIGGTNIGFEINGNFDVTVDIKNFSLKSYIKK